MGSQKLYLCMCCQAGRFPGPLPFWAWTHGGRLSGSPVSAPWGSARSTRPTCLQRAPPRTPRRCTRNSRPDNTAEAANVRTLPFRSPGTSAQWQFVQKFKKKQTRVERRNSGQRITSSRLLRNSTKLQRRHSQSARKVKRRRRVHPELGERASRTHRRQSGAERARRGCCLRRSRISVCLLTVSLGARVHAAVSLTWGEGRSKLELRDFNKSQPSPNTDTHIHTHTHAYSTHADWRCGSLTHSCLLGENTVVPLVV